MKNEKVKSLKKSFKAIDSDHEVVGQNHNGNGNNGSNTALVSKVKTF